LHFFYLAARALLRFHCDAFGGCYWREKSAGAPELVAFQFFTRTLTAYLFAESALHTHTYKQRTAAAELNIKWIYTHGGV
jgi:hypothetical protein